MATKKQLRTKKAREVLAKRRISKKKSKAGASRTRPPKTALQAALERIAAGETTDLTCEDFRIGASQVLDVLTGKHDLEAAHGRYTTDREKKRVGDLGEYAFQVELDRANNSAAIKRFQCLGRLNCLPAVVACPDFLVREDGEYRVVEVKTSERKVGLLTIPKRDAVQVWVTMDVFHLKTARLVYYFHDQADGTIAQEASFLIQKTEPFFNRSVLALFLPNYLEFLGQLLRMNGLAFGRTDQNAFKRMVDNRFARYGSQRTKEGACFDSEVAFRSAPVCKQLFTALFPSDTRLRYLLAYPTWTIPKEFPPSRLTPEFDKAEFKARSDEALERLRKLPAPPTVSRTVVKTTAVTFDDSFRQKLLEGTGQRERGRVAEVDREKLDKVTRVIKELKDEDGLDYEGMYLPGPRVPELLERLGMAVEQPIGSHKMTRTQQKELLEEMLEWRRKADHYLRLLQDHGIDP